MSMKPDSATGIRGLYQVSNLTWAAYVGWNAHQPPQRTGPVLGKLSGVAVVVMIAIPVALVDKQP